tara:strand:+ start:334 stop:828 length:495 start_codon:yes stop_codon:yes gene_type:complete
MKEKLPFRAWFYFRQGYGLYFAFILAGINTLTLTYFLAIENYPLLKEVFPTFVHYVIILVAIGVPALITVGYLHYKRSPAYRSEAGIMQETNPYARRNLINSEMNLQINLEVLKIIIELSRDGKIEKTQMDKILKLKDELTNYHTSRSFTNDSDMKYLRRLQKT